MSAVLSDGPGKYKENTQLVSHLRWNYLQAAQGSLTPNCGTTVSGPAEVLACYAQTPRTNERKGSARLSGERPWRKSVTRSVLNMAITVAKVTRSSSVWTWGAKTQPKTQVCWRYRHTWRKKWGWWLSLTYLV
jgi:hypothetical protein